MQLEKHYDSGFDSNLDSILQKFVEAGRLIQTFDDTSRTGRLISGNDMATQLRIKESEHLIRQSELKQHREEQRRLLRSRSVSPDLDMLFKTSKVSAMNGKKVNIES